MDLPKIYRYKGEHSPWAHAKLDGWALRVDLEVDGNMYAITRKPQNLTDTLSCCKWWGPMYDRMRNGSLPSVFGELYLPGGQATDVPHALKQNPQVLDFAPFASVYLPVGLGIPETVQSLKNATGIESPQVLSKHGFQLYDKYNGWNVERLHKMAANRGYEGWVLKEGNLLMWYKLKVERTVDCVVSDIIDGKGQYCGMVGALVLSLEGEEIASAGGMTLEERSAMSSRDVGRVCEVAYQCVGKQGRLRHPRFVRWRDDKPAADCTLDQLEK